MNISQAGIDLTKRHEQCRLVAYKDPAGVWTCGWGATGTDIYEGVIWTQEQADSRLRMDHAVFSRCVDSACPQASQGQFDAMVDLAYNIGESAFNKSSVARLHNAGRFSEAGQAFGLFNKAGGRVLIELVHRRAEEAAMYAAATTVPENVRVDVPVNAKVEKPMIGSKTLISTATAAAGTAASVVSQVHDQARAVSDAVNQVEDSVNTGFHLWHMLGNHLGWIAVALILAGICGILYDYIIRHRSGRS